MGVRWGAGTRFDRTQAVKSDRPRFKSWLSHFIDELTSGKLFNLSKPQHSHLYNRLTMVPLQRTGVRIKGDYLYKVLSTMPGKTFLLLLSHFPRGPQCCRASPSESHTQLLADTLVTRVGRNPPSRSSKYLLKSAAGGLHRRLGRTCHPLRGREFAPTLGDFKASQS